MLLYTIVLYIPAVVYWIGSLADVHIIDASMFHCRDVEMTSCVAYGHIKYMETHHIEAHVEMNYDVDVAADHTEEPTYLTIT